MYCVFVPLKARNIVMQSALQFTEALDEEPVQKHALAPSPYKITASPKLYAGAGVYPLISVRDFQSKNTSEARITN